MPYQVQQIIEGKGSPVCITKDEPVSKALALMIEHDYSQLPVIKRENGLDIPEGMITYEGILRGIRNFKAKIEDLKVRDVMVDAPVYSCEDDLFDIMDRLKDTNAVLVIEGPAPHLVGIVTSYDATEYFRNRTEDLMRVEDIELMVKEFIKIAFTDKNGEVDEVKLADVIAQVTDYKKANAPNGKQLAFEDLNLSDYISLLLQKVTWAVVGPIFGVQSGFVGELLHGVRVIRNALAHFRGDITAEQRDRLKFSAEWLTRRRDELQAKLETAAAKELLKLAEEHQAATPALVVAEGKAAHVTGSDSTLTLVFAVTEAATGGGRYAVLADWLQSQPGAVDKIQLTFNQIEEIVGADLPASARTHRAWWANDSVGHTQSRLWLEAGWRTTYVNLSEGRITFSRIQEREKGYIVFFSSLLDELRKKANFPIREASPDGASWIVIQTVPRGGGALSSFVFSFSRDKRLRVELYLDLGDKTQTKTAFAALFSRKEQFEAALGPIEWERLDNRRASRLALYHEGHIADDKGHAQLRKWAAETMVKFYNTLAKPAEKAILEAQQG